MRNIRTLKKLKRTTTVSETMGGRPATHTRVMRNKIQNPSTCRATLFRCSFSRFWVDVSRFSPCMINLSRNKNVRWSFDVGWGKLLQKVECGFTLTLSLVVSIGFRDVLLLRRMLWELFYQSLQFIVWEVKIVSPWKLINLIKIKIALCYLHETRS